MSGKSGKALVIAYAVAGVMLLATILSYRPTPPQPGDEGLSIGILIVIHAIASLI